MSTGSVTRRLRTSACVAATFVGFGMLVEAQAVRPRAFTASDFFDGSTLQEIRIFVNSRDLADLRERYWEKKWYPADVQWRDIRMANAGIRTRGFGSRTFRPPKTSVPTSWPCR